MSMISYRMILSRHIYLMKTININRLTPQSNLFIDISVSFFFLLFFSLSPPVSYSLFNPSISILFFVSVECALHVHYTSVLILFFMPLSSAEWLVEHTHAVSIVLAWHMSMGDGYYEYDLANPFLTRTRSSYEHSCKEW